MVQGDNGALSNAHEQVAESKYVCARCASPDITIECRTCRNIYCKACSDHLHVDQGFTDHELRDFDPEYEAYKRATKRGTKFDSNAPSPKFLPKGQPAEFMHRTTKIGFGLMLLAVILGIVAVATNLFSTCQTYKDGPKTNIGEWRRCTEGECDGTLYFSFSLSCEEDNFRVPVNFARAFTIGGMFWAVCGLLLFMWAQCGAKKAMAILKAGGMCCFLSCLGFLIGNIIWMFVTLHDVDCSGQPRPICVYGPGGHCNFNIGFYLAWVCMLLLFFIGGLIYDWWSGLPWLAYVEFLLTFLVQVAVAVALATNSWGEGKQDLSAGETDTWAGLWRMCSNLVTDPDREFLCVTVATWRYTGANRPVLDGTVLDCLNGGMIHAMRILLLIGLGLSTVIFITIFYAHTHRKPKAKQVGMGAAILMFIMFLVCVILWPVMMNGEHSCNGQTYPMMPIFKEASLGASWVILLIGTLICIPVIVLMKIMRVGFEKWEYLSPAGESVDKPAKYEGDEAEDQVYDEYSEQPDSQRWE